MIRKLILCLMLVMCAPLVVNAINTKNSGTRAADEARIKADEDRLKAEGARIRAEGA